MATDTSKGLPKSVQNASEEAVEKLCLFCISRDKKEVESTNFCVDCDSNMCKACTEWHTNFPAMTSHRVVGISRASIARESRDQLPTQRCEVHGHKILERFCRDHEQLACDSCAIQDHRKSDEWFHLNYNAHEALPPRNCVNLEYIPAFSKGTKTSQELLHTKVRTTSVLKALKKFRTMQQETLQKLDTAELQCMKDLKSHREKLVKRIDELTNVDSAMIKSRFEEDKDAVKQSIKHVDDQIVSMETLVNGLNQSNQSKEGNEPELFVYLKQGERAEKKSKQLLQSLQMCRKQIPKLKLYSTTGKLLDDIEALGVLYTSSKPVRLELRGEYNVRTEMEKDVCNISGVCLLPDGSVMIADSNDDSASLRQLDSSFKVTRSLKMKWIYDVCYANNNEVAVTMHINRRIQFVSVAASLKKTRSFFAEVFCRSITCSNGELFVCGSGMVDNSLIDNVLVFSLSGIHLRNILWNGHDEQPENSVVSTVTVSSCGNKVFVTDAGGYGVITTDRSGNFQQHFQHGQLMYAGAICSLDNGDQLVGCTHTGNILHVCSDGINLAVVLREHDERYKSKALVYDRINSRLIVTTSKCDTIKVYAVKQRSGV